MGSIYTVASMARECADELIIARKQSDDDAEEERKRKIEMEEDEKYRGTRVNRESFEAWKSAFLLEAKAAAKDKDKEKLTLAFKAVLAVDKLERKVIDKTKVTGRAMFEGNNALVDAEHDQAEEGEDVDYSVRIRGAIAEEEEQTALVFDEED
jgi:hypothetical protein